MAANGGAPSVLLGLGGEGRGGVGVGREVKAGQLYLFLPKASSVQRSHC